MRPILVLVLIAPALLPGCAGARQYRPGPAHAGLRSYIYEHTPMNANYPGAGRKSRPPKSTLPTWATKGQ